MPRVSTRRTQPVLRCRRKSPSVIASRSDGLNVRYSHGSRAGGCRA